MTKIILVPDGETDWSLLLTAAREALNLIEQGYGRTHELGLSSGERFAVSWPDGAVQVERVRR